MNDDWRAIEIARLTQALSAASVKRTALLAEAQEFAARIHEIRATFGNPFFYSQPRNAEESAANYSGTRSHEIVPPTLLALRRVDRELRKINDQLRELG